ncbi:hypothetical protein U1Q18_002275, partial [Sarracenia purpurea var. burkii]
MEEDGLFEHREHEALSSEGVDSKVERGATFEDIELISRVEDSLGYGRGEYLSPGRGPEGDNPLKG